MGPVPMIMTAPVSQAVRSSGEGCASLLWRCFPGQELPGPPCRPLAPAPVSARADPLGPVWNIHCHIHVQDMAPTLKDPLCARHRHMPCFTVSSPDEGCQGTHFSGGKTETQRGKDSCSESQSKSQAGIKIEPRSVGP